MGTRWQASSATGLRVAQEVLRHGPLSRAELARRFGLTPGTLTKLTKSLIADGLLLEGEPGRDGAQVGRPSAPLDLARTEETFVGVKITGNHLYGVLTGIRAEVIREADRPLTGTSPEEVVDQIAELVEELAGSEPPTGVGVTLGGVVQGGTVLLAGFLRWRGVELAELIRTRHGIDVVIENDLLGVTEAAHWFGPERGLDQFAMLTIGAGLGLGVVVNGQLVTDQGAGLGLIGHIPLEPFGPVCPDGHRGCATAILTTSAVTGAVSVAKGRPVGYDEALDLAQEGDPAAARVVGDAGQALGRLIALVANIALPRLVVVGGEGARLATVAGPAMTEAIARGRDAEAPVVPVVVQDGGLAEWARGAAVVAIQAHVGAR